MMTDHWTIHLTYEKGSCVQHKFNSEVLSKITSDKLEYCQTESKSFRRAPYRVFILVHVYSEMPKSSVPSLRDMDTSPNFVNCTLLSLKRQSYVELVKNPPSKIATPRVISIQSLMSLHVCILDLHWGARLSIAKNLAMDLLHWTP